MCYNRDEASRPTGQLGEFEQDSNTDSEQESTTDSHGAVCGSAAAVCAGLPLLRRLLLRLARFSLCTFGAWVALLPGLSELAVLVEMPRLCCSSNALEQLSTH